MRPSAVFGPRLLAPLAGLVSERFPACDPTQGERSTQRSSQAKLRKSCVSSFASRKASCVSRGLSLPIITEWLGDDCFRWLDHQI